jgi:hypothetical protein
VGVKWVGVEGGALKAKGNAAVPRLLCVHAIGRISGAGAAVNAWEVRGGEGAGLQHRGWLNVWGAAACPGWGRLG